MSNRWLPDEDPRNAGWPQPSYPPQSPGYDDPPSGYGAPGPYSSGRSRGSPPQQYDPWAEQNEPPAQQYYQPGRPYPQSPQDPYAPYGPPDPYRMQNPYGPQDPYGAYGAYGNQPAPGRRSPGVLLPIMVLLVLILIVGVGAYAVANYGRGGHTTASGTPGIPAGFHSYSSTNIGARFVVPDGWTTDDNIAIAGGHGMQATSSDGSIALAVASLPGTGNLTGGANGALAGMSSSGSVDHKEGPTNVTIAGASWVREAGDITRSGVRLHSVVFVATHGNRTFLVIFIATTSGFQNANSRYFQVTTQSFQFLT
jgi:hypothetical protein